MNYIYLVMRTDFFYGFETVDRAFLGKDLAEDFLDSLDDENGRYDFYIKRVILAG